MSNEIKKGYRESGDRSVYLLKSQQECDSLLLNIDKVENELANVVRGVEIQHSNRFRQVLYKVVQRKEIISDYMELNNVFDTLESRLRENVIALHSNVESIVEVYKKEQCELEEFDSFIQGKPNFEQYMNYIESLTGVNLSNDMRDSLSKMQKYGISNDYIMVLNGMFDLRKGYHETSQGIAIAAASSLHESMVNLARIVTLKPQLIQMTYARRNIKNSSDLTEALRNFSKKSIPLYRQSSIVSIARIIENENKWSEVSSDIAAKKFDFNKLSEAIQEVSLSNKDNKKILVQ